MQLAAQEPLEAACRLGQQARGVFQLLFNAPILQVGKCGLREAGCFSLPHPTPAPR